MKIVVLKIKLVKLLLVDGSREAILTKLQPEIVGRYLNLWKEGIRSLSSRLENSTNILFLNLPFDDSAKLVAYSTDVHFFQQY
jgi:hypothetical protein